MDEQIMANHSRVKKCKRPFDVSIISGLVQDFNKKHLNGLFTFSVDENYFHLTHGENNPKIVVSCWIEKRGRYKWIEFRHPANKVAFWLQSWLEYYISFALGGTIDDEGVGVISNRDPDTFWKTYSEYETEMWKELLAIGQGAGEMRPMCEYVDIVNGLVMTYRHMHPQLWELIGNTITAEALSFSKKGNKNV
jgi:hypothetical protein